MALDILTKFAFAGMRLLAPEKDRISEHEIMAAAFARVVEEEKAFFKDDEEKLRTMSVMLAVAFREGSLHSSVVGDCSESKPGERCKGTPHSFCTFQVHISNGGSQALNDDPVLCARTAHRMLRRSVNLCEPAKWLNWYAIGGEHACDSERGTRLSADRMYLARKVIAYWKALKTES